ncbi:MAG TPA: zinc-dependent metalloprotease, partial [Ideonella sp.]|nr:zinc-dependent metalloprotease [Ideonella sp.]
GAAPPGHATAPAPGTPPAFVSVVKGAQKIEGLLTMWQKDEKVWIELAPGDFGRPLLLSPKLASGIGEAGLFGGSMRLPGAATEEQLVEFRRIHNQVQLIARNAEFVAPAGTPEGRAVAAAFSPSLLGSAFVASQPDPESKAVLIEANGLFLSDMLGLGQALQRHYRQGYNLDARNSAILAVRGKPDEVVFETQNHYWTNSISQPQGSSGGHAPSVPRTLPDARSLFLKLHYSLARLPETPMRPRRADPRVGYFNTLVENFGDDLERTPKQHFIDRWRLEKKDPSAALSEPVRPITFWLDRTIPLKYRGAITAGVLEWNKAFEKIGFKDAIVVKVQPDDATFDTLDADVASIRWMTDASPRFGAIGPTHVDPRSGEILDADIGIESLSSRNLRALRAQVLGAASTADAMPNLPDAAAAQSAPAQRDRFACSYAAQAAEQLDYALDVLEARGELDPDGPAARQFVLDYLKDTTMHEVGHALGLRHNFRSSIAYSDAQISDLEFTREHGLSGSVMDYRPVNLPRPGEPGGTPFQTTLGPYDYWAIEYGYRPLEVDHESAQLKTIAARSNEPQLAYGTDEDNFLGIDPESLQFDLGNDVFAYARRRFDIARDLFARQERRSLARGSEYGALRRSIRYAVHDAGIAASALARQIAGVRTLRDYAGSGRDPLQPVSAARQREALDLLARNVFAADSFAASPALQRRLAPDYLERGDAVFGGEDASVATDYSIGQAVLGTQRVLLAQLLSDGVAARVLDSVGKADRPAEAFQLSELYRRLTYEVWGELAQRRDISAPRRELQRDYLNRVAAVLVRPGSLSRADARSLLRVEASGLLARIQGALRRDRALSAEARAHLQDSAETLRMALS